MCCYGYPMPTATEKRMVKGKNHIVVPRDALELLQRRYGTATEATEAAKDFVAEEGMTMYLVELKAVVSRADPPVRVRKV